MVMQKGERAGDTPIGVDVLKVNLIIGVVVEKVLNNHFVTDHIMDQNLDQSLIKLIKQKKFSSALVSKLRILRYVMDLTTKNEN